MKSDKYEPRVCEFCGRLYKPGRKDQYTCGSPECTKERKRRYATKYNTEEWREHKRNYMRRMREPEVYVPKPDTIVAIGYAERQMAETLKLAGRVDPHL